MRVTRGAYVQEQGSGTSEFQKRRENIILSLTQKRLVFSYQLRIRRILNVCLLLAVSFYLAGTAFLNHYDL